MQAAARGGEVGKWIFLKKDTEILELLSLRKDKPIPGWPVTMNTLYALSLAKVARMEW